MYRAVYSLGLWWRCQNKRRARDFSFPFPSGIEEPFVPTILAKNKNKGADRYKRDADNRIAIHDRTIRRSPEADQRNTSRQAQRRLPRPHTNAAYARRIRPVP
jgi:hypothetical protein